MCTSFSVHFLFPHFQTVPTIHLSLCQRLPLLLLVKHYNLFNSVLQAAVCQLLLLQCSSVFPCLLNCRSFFTSLLTYCFIVQTFWSVVYMSDLCCELQTNFSFSRLAVHCVDCLYMLPNWGANIDLFHLFPW